MGSAEWKLLKATVTRKRSAKDLDAHERGQVLAHLMAKGWRPKPKKARPAAAAKAVPQVRLIYALWGLLSRNGAIQDSSPSALRAWIRHWGKEDADKIGEGAPEMLPPELRHRVAEHLIQWCGRLKIRVDAVDRLPGKRASHK